MVNSSTECYDDSAFSMSRAILHGTCTMGLSVGDGYSVAEYFCSDEAVLGGEISKGFFCKNFEIILEKYQKLTFGLIERKLNV